ncbi:MAG: ATP-binding protein [Myxococcota bacterium]
MKDVKGREQNGPPEGDEDPLRQTTGGEQHLPSEFVDRILDAVADPVFVKDEKHRWIVVNQAFCDLMGRPREAILGKSDFDFFPEGEARTFWEKDELVFDGGGLNVNEEPLTDSSGNVHVLVTKKTAFVDDRGRKVLVGVIRDVTEQKRAEEALRAAHADLERRVAERTREVEEAHAHLRQAQKMEAIGQLTGGVAHDFNNLLAIVMGNLQLARMRLENDHPSWQFIRDALAAADRGATLTQRLLAFARRQALKPVPTHVNQLIEELSHLLKHTLGANIRLRLDLSEARPWILVDPVQLETALLNLAFNARDAMPKEGKLTIATETNRIDDAAAKHHEVEPGDYVRLRVSDTGCGIAPAIIHRVFEPFFTTKDGSRGSGLGLSMVYGFVRQSNGYITIQSEPGEGAVVEMGLPRCAEGAATKPGRPLRSPVAASGDAPLVLVVEDQPELLEVTASLVASLGYRTRTAADARQALALVDDGLRIDALLSDVVLPGPLNGAQLGEAIRRRLPGTPVLLMSGHAAGALTQAADFPLLHKPFHQDTLAHHLAGHLDRPPAPDE